MLDRVYWFWLYSNPEETKIVEREKISYDNRYCKGSFGYTCGAILMRSQVDSTYWWNLTGKPGSVVAIWGPPYSERSTSLR